MRKLVLTSAACCLFPVATAQAHPHLFVGVDVTLIYENGTPTAVQLAWQYDEFFSLLLTADLGIDLDGDMQLTASEQEALTAAVADWPEDFGGDLEVKRGEALAALGPRTAHSMTYSDGLIREIHQRPIVSLPEGDADLTVRVYDPFYYVSYSLNGPVLIEGADNCSAIVIPPDLNAAYSLAEELLYGRPASDVGADEAFPEIGAEFAETITIKCV